MSHFLYSGKSFSHNDQRNFKQIRADESKKQLAGPTRMPFAGHEILPGPSGGINFQANAKKI
jgi:hypothetical protein